MGEKKQSSIRINKVYTKSGDKGMTKIVSGEKRSKSDARIEAYGCIDELNAHLGYCKDLLMETKNNDLIILADYLIKVQNELFNVGTQIATSDVENEYPRISEESIKVRLEVYLNETEPLVDFYSKKNLLTKINALGSR